MPRLTAVRREEERVTALELFFDLVFVLAITQCTALMADNPTWTGLLEGLVVLAVLWWSWVGYAWLTSVVDPEEGSVRLVIFAAMAALLVASLCVPDAFGDLGLTFAVAYGVVRVAQHRAVPDRQPRRPDGCGARSSASPSSTAVGVGLLVVGVVPRRLGAGLRCGPPRCSSTWAARTCSAPRAGGCIPEHFAERHGLIIIIALGESIVAIGVGAEAGVDAGVIVAAVLGVAVGRRPVVGLLRRRRHRRRRALAAAEPGRDQNEMARDSYSYLHLPMVAGIVLVALGLKTTLAHVADPLDAVPATALVGGASLYLLAHVAFRLRNIGTLSVQRLVVAVVMLGCIPVAQHVPAVVTVGIVTALHAALIAYEEAHFAAAHDQIRHQVRTDG